MMDKDKRAAALETFRRRLAGKDIPVGYVDGTGRWRPSAACGERMPCCDALEGTEADRWSLYQHCLGARHAGMLHGLEGRALAEFTEGALRACYGKALGRDYGACGLEDPEEPGLAEAL